MNFNVFHSPNTLANVIVIPHIEIKRIFQTNGVNLQLTCSKASCHTASYTEKMTKTKPPFLFGMNFKSVTVVWVAHQSVLWLAVFIHNCHSVEVKHVSEFLWRWDMHTMECGYNYLTRHWGCCHGDDGLQGHAVWGAFVLSRPLKLLLSVLHPVRVWCRSPGKGDIIAGVFFAKGQTLDLFRRGSQTFMKGRRAYRVFSVQVNFQYPVRFYCICFSLVSLNY